MRKVFIISLLAIISLFSLGFTHPWKLVTEEYVVQEKESLEDIAKKFIVKNTYGKREIKEFTESICELNDLEDKDVKPGTKLKVNYWIKIERDEKNVRDS